MGHRSTLRQCFGGNATSDEAGFTLLEVAIALSLVMVILLGVMAALSTGFAAQRQNSENVQSQLLVQQVLEELQDNTFEELVTFNGQYVMSESGEHRADITASYVDGNLVRVQVVTSSTAHPEISSRAVTLVADRD